MLLTKHLSVFITAIAVLFFAISFLNAGASKKKYDGSGTIPVFTEARIDTLYDFLYKLNDDKYYDTTLAFIFKDVYLSDLADLLIFIPSDGCVKQQIVMNNKVQLKDKWLQLRGIKDLYILIFIEETNKNADSTGCFSFYPNSEELKTKVSNTQLKLIRQGNEFKLIKEEEKSERIKLDKSMKLKVFKESIDYRSDSFIRKSIKTFGQMFAGISVAEDKKECKDSATIISATNLGCGEKNKKILYVAVCKIPVEEDSWTRISVSGSQNKPITKKACAVVTNFSNVSSSPYGIGLAYTAAINTTNEVSNDTTRYGYNNPRLNLCMYCVLYIWNRPSIPKNNPLIGICLGTSIVSHSFLDDIILGLTFSWERFPTVMTGITLFTKNKIDERSIGYFFGLGFEI